MPRQRAGSLSTAVAILLILAATLPPSYAPQGEIVRPCLLLCGTEGLADFLVNILLYAPLGVGLALRGWRPRAVVLTAFLLSAGIEALQVVLPGRDSSAGDILANALGAATGLGLMRGAARWLRPAPTIASRLAVGWALAFAATVALTAWLLQPSFPPGNWYGQWTPRFGHMAAYEGRVVSVRLGPLEVPAWQHPRSDSLRTLLTGGAPLEVRFVKGPAPAEQAPIFAIADGRQRTMLMLAAERADVRLSLRRRAAGFRLDAPDIRLRNWLTGLAAGDTATARLWDSSEGLCLELNARRECGLGFPPGRGWAILYWLDWAPDWLLRTLDVLWVAALLAPLGLWMRTTPGWMLAAGLGLAVLIAVPPLTGLQPNGLVEFVGVAVGLEAGLLGRREASRHQAAAPVSGP